MLCETAERQICLAIDNDKKKIVQHLTQTAMRPVWKVADNFPHKAKFCSTLFQKQFGKYLSLNPKLGTMSDEAMKWWND